LPFFSSLPESKAVVATNTEIGLLSFPFFHLSPLISYLSAKQILMKPDIFQKNDGVTLDGKRVTNISRFLIPLNGSAKSLKAQVVF
jgi:hypothetical protein